MVPGHLKCLLTLHNHLFARHIKKRAKMDTMNLWLITYKVGVIEQWVQQYN